MTTTDSLILSLTDLPRALGSTRHTSLAWIVPDDLGTSSMRVAPGTQLPLDVDLTSVDDGVLVRLSTSVDLVGECVRCLDPVLHHHDVTAAEVYFEGPASTRGRAEPIDEGREAEDDTARIGPHDTIDLEPLLRDSVVTLIDPLPLCRPDCPGLCPVCGERLADLPTDHHHDIVDPRLAGLAALLDRVEEDPH